MLCASLGSGFRLTAAAACAQKKKVVATATKINEKIDIPVLNEKQEQEAIEFVLHAMAERFLASQGKTIEKKKGKGKMFGFI